MKEISLTDEVDILANIEDLSREIMNEQFESHSPAKKKAMKTWEINLDFEEPP